MSDGETSNVKSEYESRKAEKMAVQEAAERLRKSRATSKKISWMVFCIAVVLLIVWGIVALARSGQPQGEDLSRAVEIQGADHIPVDASHPPYNSNPPASGPHYAKTARVDFYTEEIPDEYIVHNLEHGHVWIAYHPRISDEAKRTLKSFSGGRVVITSRLANDTDFALVSWGRLDAFDFPNGVVPAERISDFVKRYLNKGPEKIPPGAHENTFN